MSRIAILSCNSAQRLLNSTRAVTSLKNSTNWGTLFFFVWIHNSVLRQPQNEIQIKSIKHAQKKRLLDEAVACITLWVAELTHVMGQTFNTRISFYKSQHCFWDFTLTIKEIDSPVFNIWILNTSRKCFFLLFFAGRLYFRAERMTLSTRCPAAGAGTPWAERKTIQLSHSNVSGNCRWFKPVLRIHDILAWIRIRGSTPLTSGSGSGFFRHWHSRP